MEPGRRALKVHAVGRYAHRQPFAYAPVRAACAGRIAVVDRPDAADVVLLAHWKDAVAEAPRLDAALGRGQRVVLLSEEPFWDTMWCPAPFQRDQTLPGAGRPLTVLNHFTGDLFDFDRIPYFLLTDPAYCARYARMLARNAAMAPPEWHARWAAARWHAAFALERRDHPAHDRFWPAHGAQGLAAHRTRIARACRGRVLRMGKGWTGEAGRQGQGDWHADKLARFDGQARAIFAMENTWWPSYVTEKPFDALACGALPAVLAGPPAPSGRAHRLHDLLPPEAMLDLAGLSAPEAAAALRAARPDAAALRAACADLAPRLAPAAITAELARLAAALAQALET